MNKQFKDVLPESETCSSLSEDDPVLSNYEGDKNLAKTSRRKTDSDSEDSSLAGKPHEKKETNLSKTVNPKLSPAFHKTAKPKQIVKGHEGFLRNLSSGSEASSELSAEHGTESGDSTPDSPDKFNIKYIQGMRSNDYEAPSTSVRSNFGSESVGKSGYGSDLSQSSLVSQESVVRKTLARAKQRKENFW